MNGPPTTPDALPARAAELELLLACTRWPQSEADREVVRRQAARPIDWEQFIELVQHHRLVPLVAHNLNAAVAAGGSAEQKAALDELRQQAAANTFRALRSLGEMRRVVQEFEAHGISVRVLKGIPLAQEVFGDLSLRATGDLDLMIDEDSILEADRLLRGFGYRGLFQVDRFTPKRLAFYRSHWKDLAYENAASGYEVDLHWRCFRNSAMPGGALSDAAAGDGQQPTVSFGSFTVKTLPPMETLLYLCVHGTLDGWLYLKSLADVSAQVRAMETAELDSLAELAASYGVLPELSAALTLTSRYFGMEHWSERLLGEGDPTVAHILEFADHSLEQGGFLSGREAIRATSMMAFEIGLRRNFRYRMELLLRVMFRARMWETIPLPDFLFGIYPLLSPFEWIAFRIRQWMEKPPTSAMLSI